MTFLFKTKRVHFIFKDLFEYSFLSINPQKYAFFFGPKSLSKDDIPAAKQRLINSLRSKDLAGKEYDTNATPLLNAYKQLSLSPLGRTILQRAGKNLGEVLGKNIDEVYFKDYLQGINRTFKDLHIAELDVLNTDTLSCDLELKNNIFSNQTEQNCHFFEGVLEGILESYTNTPWSVTETKCTSLGTERCVFECRNI